MIVHRGMAGRLAEAFLNSRLTPLVILFSILLGLGATLILPREEEPQIVVPMADVLVSMPGASAKEVEQRVTFPMEKLAKELPGVEYVYSTSSPGASMMIVRFLVGTPSEDAVVRLYNKLYANFDRIPPGASRPLIKSRAIDDVPILALTFSSSTMSAYQLRQVVARLDEEVRQVEDVSETRIHGGLRRQMAVRLRPDRLHAFALTPAQVVRALEGVNQSLQGGTLNRQDQTLTLQVGQFLRSAREVGDVVVAVRGGRPVRLGDVASVQDGVEEPGEHVVFGTRQGTQPAVTLSVAKRPGANAIQVSHRVLSKIEAIRSQLIPSAVTVTVTRDYGETAAERSNELLVHMLVAVVSVTALIWFSLGRRESVVVAVAIPVTLALTLATFVLYHFTLNRVTFFALIFSIGILVDDAIVVVENVVRHLRMPANQGRPAGEVVLEAVSEVGNPTILATLTVVAAILPMAFVRGLMGPYMLPIPLGASAAMLFSVLVAFTVVPWAALRILGKGGDHSGHEAEDFLTRVYRRGMGWLLSRSLYRWGFLGLTGFLLLAAMAFVPLRLVIFKMLPFDNKSEFQVLLDMPEGSSLERTLAVAQELGRAVSEDEDVTHYQVYAGTSAPFNFNGLVRHYFLRSGPHLADLQVNLKPKSERGRQSHQIAKGMRPRLAAIGKKWGAVVQVAEIPPGPPVLQTLVTEVYGPERRVLAARIKEIFNQTEGVVDVDWYVEDRYPRVDLRVDQEKAALSGLSMGEIADNVELAVRGRQVGLLHLGSWREDVPIVVRLEQSARSGLEFLETLALPGRNGRPVPLGSVFQSVETESEESIYHKNLQPVIYVTGDVAGRLDSPLYSILDVTLKMWRELPGVDVFFFRMPENTQVSAVKWDGEWQVTFEVFRDLGIAFAVVLILIYALIVGWFQDFLTPLVILSAIPFSLVGIMPAHALLGSFFTATSMIGFIAGAGIVVRNSIILVDFVELRLAEGVPLAQAVVDAGAVRFRPMLLTAAAVVVGSAVMLADPIFSGLAVSLMAGEVASLLLSRTAVPVLYFMLWNGRRRS